MGGSAYSVQVRRASLHSHSTWHASPTIHFVEVWVADGSWQIAFGEAYYVGLAVAYLLTLHKAPILLVIL